MKISSQTKISKILKHNIEAIEVIASINVNFKKLRNPILRTVLAPRVTIADASRIGKCDINHLFDALEKIGFERDEQSKPIHSTSHDSTYIKDANIFLGNCDLVEFDIRPVLDKNEDPFNSIMAILTKLSNSNILEITSPFEPIPLIRIVEKKGYETLTIETNNLYKLYIKKSKTTQVIVHDEIYNDPSETRTLLSKFKGRIQELDVRNLEMPLPFVTILEELSTLKPDYALFVHHKRIPQFLLPKINEMGFTYQIFEIDNETVEIIIYKQS